jgi:hypothetical protein
MSFNSPGEIFLSHTDKDKRSNCIQERGRGVERSIAPWMNTPPGRSAPIVNHRKPGSICGPHTSGQDGPWHEDIRRYEVALNSVTNHLEQWRMDKKDFTTQMTHWVFDMELGALTAIRLR